MNSRLILYPILLSLLAPFLIQGDDTEKNKENSPAVEVQMAKIIRTTLKRKITVYGIIEPEPGGRDHPAALAQLSPAISGIITKINGVEGQRVTKGDILFQLDSRAAQAALEKAETKVKFATENLARQKKLIAARATSEKQILETEQLLADAEAELAGARVNLSLLSGKAPISGTITSFLARVGESAGPATVLAELVDLNHLVATVQVPGLHISEIKTGQKADILRPDHQKPTAASVSFVGSRADPNSGTVTARLHISENSGLMPGQLVTAIIVVEEKPNCLAVPREAVFTDVDGKSTLSLVIDGSSKKVAVRAGLRDEKLVEVEGEGIREGAVVVTLGSYALPSETRVRPASR